MSLSDVARAASEAAGGNGATREIPLSEARQKLGPYADALALDQIVESRRGDELGWHPRHPSFVAEAGKAYQEWRSAAAGAN